MFVPVMGALFKKGGHVRVLYTQGWIPTLGDCDLHGRVDYPRSISVFYKRLSLVSNSTRTVQNWTMKTFSNVISF